MEEQTQKRLDNVLEDELQRGYRIKSLPDNLQRLLAAECGVAVSRVRFTRLNPAKRRKIAQVVQRQYHKDLQNQDILSKEQILKLVQERGEWSEKLDEEMKNLQESTSREMGLLFADGMEYQQWTEQLLDAAEVFRAKVEALGPEKLEEVFARFDRWLEFSPDKQERYNEEHAKSQDKERYSADFDLQRLMEAVPDLEAVDALNLIDEVRDKLHRYVKLQRDRVRLADLQVRFYKIFSDSVEQRRDNAEEMARLYFTTEIVDDKDVPTGPVAKDFDALWDFPEEVIQWFLVEAYFFMNGVPDEAREYLQTFGFIAADAGETISRAGESEPSDESPAPQSSKPGSSLPEETASVSSVTPLVTTSTTAS